MHLVSENDSLYFVNSKNKAVKYKTDTLCDLTIIGSKSRSIPAAASILGNIINM
ncbi:hypothetical protein [Peptoniphilus porci]|uniref:hypothetical protein n=1 Tax=Peptoniphilus porci TaxID=2652280 RepID=UPI0015C1B508|nr:hypothetical protein [Peptoniphilus porci]